MPIWTQELKLDKQPPSMSKPIYFIGFMGAGKTNSGKKIAHQLQMNFIDLDKAIELKVKQPISQLFEEKGEMFFREIESEVLKECSLPNTLISCGGGTPCFNRNIDFMFDHGIVVYLKLEPGILVSRLLTNRAKRPLVANLTEEELVNYVYQTLAERESFYINAHIIFHPLQEKLDNLILQLQRLQDN